MSNQVTLQEQTLDLRQGFYVFRYLHAQEGANPVITIEALDGRAQLLGTPLGKAYVLRKFGDMAVLHARATEPAEVQVSIAVPHDFPKQQIDLHVERLSAQPTERSGARKADPLPLHIAGVFSDRSLREARLGEWLGESSKPKERLIGFRAWLKGRGNAADLRYKCRFRSGEWSAIRSAPDLISAPSFDDALTGIAVFLDGAQEIHPILLQDVIFEKAGRVICPAGEEVCATEEDDIISACRLVC